MSKEDDTRLAEALGFDAARRGRLRELFDHYDVDQSRTLDANEIECMIVELGHEADHSRARALLEEFGDVSRGDGADGRSISFPAFLRLVSKLEPNREAEEPAPTIMTALFRRFSFSSREHPPAATGAGALPAGWRKLDDGAGNAYYYNEASGVSSWEPPSSAAAEAEPEIETPPPPPGAPPGVLPPPSPSADEEYLVKNKAQVLKEYEIEDKELAGVLRCFRAYDTDMSGYLDRPETSKMLKDLNRPCAEADITELFEHVDVDNSGRIEFFEFLKFWVQSSGAEEKEHEVVKRKAQNLDDHVFLYTVQTVLKSTGQNSWTYTVENAQLKHVSFTMDFAGSENVRLAGGVAPELKAVVNIAPFQRVVVAKLTQTGHSGCSLSNRMGWTTTSAGAVVKEVNEADARVADAANVARIAKQGPPPPCLC